MLIPLFNERAILLKNGTLNVLIIADIHIGFEVELYNQGIRIPFQTDKILSNLLKIVNKYRVKRLIILGDLKHTILGYSKTEMNEVRAFLSEASKNLEKISIILGNHDTGLKEELKEYFDNVEFFSGRGITVKSEEKRIGLFHGHALPTRDVLESEILVQGHVHPLVELEDDFHFKFTRAVWLVVPITPKKIYDRYAKRFLSSDKEFIVKAKKLIVMPAFNPFIGGLVINSENIKERSPILGSLDEEILNSDIYLVDGIFLGKLKLLKSKH